MRLFALQAFIFLLGFRVLIGVHAGPVHELRITEFVQEERTLDSRAPTYAVELEQVGQVQDTFAETKILPGVFAIPFTDQKVQEAAKATFDLWDSKQRFPNQLLLVAVVAVPGHGLAAGTIWHGMDETFKEYAQNDAPKLWTLAQRQGNRGGISQSLWHAEVVASWVAEKSFPDGKEGARWPAGTKVAVYGRWTDKDAEEKGEIVTGYKPVCAVGSTGNRIPCATLMSAQRISIVNP